jgi:hypothetical protein
VHGLQCRGQPEPAQYNGGILRYSNSDDPTGYKTTETGVLSPAFVVYDLNKTTMYTFSGEPPVPAPFSLSELAHWFVLAASIVLFHVTLCRLDQTGRLFLGSGHRETRPGQLRHQVHRDGSCQERLLVLPQRRLHPGLANADLGHLLSER